MSYLPRLESAQVKWSKNFLAKLTVHSDTVSVTAAELATVKADVECLCYLLGDMLPAYRAKAQEITAYKDLIKHGPIGTPGGTLPVPPTLPKAPATVLPGVMPRITQLVQRIKKSPGYNVAIGADLGIEAPALSPVVGDAAKPTFNATALPGGQVRLDWVKGKFDGVRVESKRAADPDFAPLGDDRFSPYEDSRPNLKPGDSEIRSYRLRYLKKDELVGTYSDIVTALAVP